MSKKWKINPELKQIARNVPYNKVIIKCANIFQAISFRLTRTPKEVVNRNIAIEGYKGLKFKVEIFEPSNVKEKLPCLIYVHGGAFSYKASAYHKKLACIYAMKVKCRVYFPDYHLTPKYPYPAAYEDVLALYRCIMKNNKRMWLYYCKNLKVEDTYCASPMHSSLPQIIPDTYIETAEYDCLHDEGIIYGKRLWEAGANVEVNETIGTIHGYDSALNTKIAISNIKKRILFLKKELI